MKKTFDAYTAGALLEAVKEEHEENRKVARVIKESLSFEVVQALVLEVLKEDREFYMEGDDTPLMSAYDLIIKYYSIQED